ncbi:Glyoxalase/bleomycin resistance protein/dioxygenase [Rhizorhabdus wittichii RW1]|uniref:Glyoxalase/bleomycin resistance protein/dioxygenase n=2 Tax=Rhizorhabdus wittichii TaxID=160791 RepID=A0A9J9HDG9_RHIWR|nr:VOC family protein [Rhizorhabdus wittichii]ABQ69369.1 Glyoxalase/bleomycin resistance protein/dioxygenase [Rhizorhabdus wittichii RW1]QTH20097.1 VOC family protein [Rhizorhabdus wittichii]
MPAIRPSLAHLGIFVSDLDRMERFYADVFGLVVTDRGVGAVFKNRLVFMSGSADQHHQVVLSTGRQADAPSTIMQLSFKVASLAELRDVQARAAAHGATEMIGLNHGNAWSIYFYDPEMNRIEIYLDTDFHTPQPCADPLDLAKSDEEIVAETRALVEARPGGMDRRKYVEAMQGVLARN